ncbi:MAG: dicarboxylate/amino acid:cation symporter [Methylococcus sp.]|nr:MAG: dicarboxylate/amino acid:cation symporter [Methylococcus sp.]
MRLSPFHWPLSVQVFVAMILGIALGEFGRTQPYLGGLVNNTLGQIGMMIIRFLKALAVPLILFGVLDAIISSPVTAKIAGRLAIICLINVTVAFGIGLTLMNTLRPGDAWRGHTEELIEKLGGPQTPLGQGLKPTLDPLQSLSGLIPNDLLEPFLHNNVIAVVLLAILFGAAIRSIRGRTIDGVPVHLDAIEQAIRGLYQIFARVLTWSVRIVPLAVLGLVAHAVAKLGLSLFQDLISYGGIVLLGLSLHGLIYYPFMAFFAGGITPRHYLGQGADALLTGMATNSSLATVPITLRCLQRMGVSDTSARLAACAGTNFNNDGVTLYEAITALFLAQAIGFDLTPFEQLIVVLSSLMASIGIAGVPEAGLIILPLVLGSAGLPDAVVAAAIPLIAPIDWILARCRSAVNVLSDMLVAILLDAWNQRAGQRQ